MARRLLGRFALLAFGLYHVPLLLNNYPSLGGGGFSHDGLASSWGHVFGQVGVWVARHVFGVTGDLTEGLGGDVSDTVGEYCRLLVGVVIAAVAAVIWTLADRRRPRARWVEDALHVLLRYAIVLGLASFGVEKLYPVMFGELPATTLEQRVGELTPMALLWAFMSYSRIYTVFAGIMELVVVVLLCFRRTALLGALVGISVMLNVALMNYSYNVGLKLYSTSIVLAAVVLVLYDARRLLDLFVLRRPVPAAPARPPFRSRRLNQARWIVKIVCVGGVIVSSAVVMRDRVARRTADEASPLYGTWEVTSFVAGGREQAQTAEPTRWRRLSWWRGRAAVRREDDALVFCGATLDAAAQTVSVKCPAQRDGLVRWTRRGDELRLDGTLDGAPVTVTLERRAEAALPLLKTPFRWTID
ncbi:MAG TPA: hypothetical protein VF469_06475 [Kofleriaceae bacterium]